MLSLAKMPKKKASVARLLEADEYFSQQWLLGSSFINKSFVNKQFGRNQANIALTRYFNVSQRGSNVSGKLTSVQARSMEDLPDDRQEFLMQSALTKELTKDITEIIGEPPEESDTSSVICIRRENRQRAIDWCVEHKKFHLITPVRILMTRLLWTVHYAEKSNRYYAKWPFCLTNWPGALRRIILSGVDFDLTNSIGQFVLEKIGADMENYPAAKFYLENPDKVRETLVGTLGIDTKQAKKVLHATVNGAAITPSSIVGKNSALVDIITQEQALRYVETFKDLVSQLKTLRKKIAPTNKAFIGEYFIWEKQKTGTLFSGTGLIMHDGIDGCSLSTVIPPEYTNTIKASETRGVWDEDNSETVIDRLVNW